MKIWKRAAEYRSLILITCASLFPAVLWGVISRAGFTHTSYLVESASLWILLSVSLSICHMYYARLIDGLKGSVEKQEYEIRWKNLMLDNTDELFIVLNMYGQIVTANQSFEALMGLARSELQGQPLRAVFLHEVYEDNSNLSYVLLDRLRDVFSGKDADFTYSFRFRGTDRVVSLTLGMQPVFKDGELQNILVSGHAVQSDDITFNYLVRESSYYRMDNNISQLYQLSHRLTRNLERWMPTKQIYLLQMALQEVLINAVEHGNLEIDYHQKTELQMKKGNYWDILIKECDIEFLNERKVHVSYTLDDEKVKYVVKDEGKGFEWRKYLEQDNGKAEGDFIRTHHGIGLQLVRNVFDLTFDGKGSEVTMVRYFNS